MSGDKKDIFANIKSIANGVFTTTVTTTKISDGEMPKSFDKAFSKMDEAFAEMDKGFKEIKWDCSIEGDSSVVEIVRATKDDALKATDPYTTQGYRLRDLVEDTKLGVWKATLIFKKDK